MSLQFIGNVWINLQLVLLLPLILMQVYATTFVQFGDTAGVIYPTIEEGNIFLKEAYLQIDTISKWERETAGFEPHHAIEMNFNAEYVIQNDSDQADLPINIPLMTPLDDSSLSFTFNELAVNYTNVEYANLRQTGTGVNLYTLDLTIPEGTSVLEVNATSRGIAGSETDFTIMLEEVSRWSKPIEKLVVSSTHANGLITSYSIPPSKTTLKAATWEFNTVPTQDLTIRWKITESPVGSGIDVSKLQPPDPLIPPIIAIIVGGAIIGFIAYIRVKRKRSGSVN
ncbi:MAG: hypothetical protein HMLIMOIP_001252 [Candidatus Nitrosomirales archaeon]|jgi:hypothetical protein